jgi:hypothetical protein
MNKNWTSVFDIVVKYLPALISMAEGLFSWKTKSGADKKAFVIGTLKTVTAGIASESTGGQKDTWTVIGPSVDMALEGLVGVAQATGVFVTPVDDNAKISMG